MCEKLKTILIEFNVSEIYEELIAAGIQYSDLEYMNEMDIADAVQKIGPRAKFREKLFAWRNQNKDNIPDKEHQLIFHLKSLGKILEETFSSRAVLEFQKTHKNLNDCFRNRLINVIIKHTLEKDLSLSPKNFETI